jgi:hypothetical protein
MENELRTEKIKKMITNMNPKNKNLTVTVLILGLFLNFNFRGSFNPVRN